MIVLGLSSGNIYLGSLDVFIFAKMWDEVVSLGWIRRRPVVNVIVYLLSEGSILFGGLDIIILSKMRDKVIHLKSIGLWCWTPRPKWLSSDSDTLHAGNQG